MYDDCMLPLILFEVQVCSMYVANVILFSSMSNVYSEGYINSQFHAHRNVHAPHLESHQPSLVSFLTSYFDSNVALISDLYLNYKVKETFVLPEILL